MSGVDNLSENSWRVIVVEGSLLLPSPRYYESVRDLQGTGENRGGVCSGAEGGVQSDARVDCPNKTISTFQDKNAESRNVGRGKGAGGGGGVKGGVEGGCAQNSGLRLVAAAGVL